MKLSRADKKLLGVAMRSSQESRVTMDDMVEATGRSPQFIYDRLHDPDFKPLFLEALKTTLTAEVPAILQKFAEEGKAGSFKHGKLILEIAGVYDEQTTLKVDGKLDVRETPFRSEEEKENFLKATLAEYLNKGGEI